MKHLTDTQKRTLAYLRGADHASVGRIFRVTGATSATLQSLAARGLIEPYRHASYRITDLGKAAQL